MVTSGAAPLIVSAFRRVRGLRKGRILTLDISGRPRAYLLSFLDQFVFMDFPW
jgi:hypothetical protein